jgi:hypothetical protein
MDRHSADQPPETARPDSAKEEPPPFLGSWRRVYLAIVIYLATVIALFGLFTRSFNR